VVERMLVRCLRVVLSWALISSAAQGAQREPDLVLRGTIEAAAHQTYRVVPFDVPEGVSGLEIRFDYSGRDARTTIDLGLLAPGDGFEQAFRGWSGGNKSRFFVGSNDATPSYLPGPIAPGRWNLLLGVPNIRAGQTSTYVAEILFQRERQADVRTPAVLKSEARWYRGDLHLHTGHSDGNCSSRSGQQRVPCPTFLTLNTAVERGLDFVALTEHNTISHLRELSALQPYFDDLLLVPGMELTTFQGHANAFGLHGPVDFRVGSEGVPEWNALLRELTRQGAFVSVNHPRLPSGEICMGCGWMPSSAVDWSLLQAIEVVNGNMAEGSYAGMGFWQERLQEGRRPTAIGGSDTHDISAKDGLMPPARVGVPTTVVYAEELSTAAILDGLRAGRVFIDVAGSRDRTLEMSARVGERTIAMGGEIAMAENERAEVSIQVANVRGGRVQITRDGVVLEAQPAIDADTFRYTLVEKGDGRRHWLRVDVRDAQQRLVLIGNPIYVNRRSTKAGGP
jgi:hypothetical protein